MKKKTVKIIYVAIAVFFVSIFVLSFIFRKDLTSFFSKELQIYGLVFLFFASVLLEGIPQYIAPQLLAFNAALLGFGFWETVLSLYFGCVVGSIIGFEIGRVLKKGVYENLFSKKSSKKVKKKMDKYGGLFVFLTAISPLPYIPMIFGILHVKRKKFLLLGVLPRIIYFIYMAIIAYSVF